MNPNIKQLYDKAVETRYKLIHGIITTERAREELREYAKVFNESARAISKEFGTTSKTFDTIAFLR